jgi:hypothetical protein
MEAARGNATNPGIQVIQPITVAITKPNITESAPRSLEIACSSSKVRINPPLYRLPPPVQMSTVVRLRTHVWWQCLASPCFTVSPSASVQVNDIDITRKSPKNPCIFKGFQDSETRINLFLLNFRILLWLIYDPYIIQNNDF